MDENETRKPPIEDGSPIMVGGGGGSSGQLDRIRSKMRCVFDEGFYPDPEPRGGPKRKSFKRLASIQTFKICASGELVDHSSLLPSDRKCTIKVSCKSSDDDVTIFSRDPDPQSEITEFGIEMHTGTYRKPPANPTSHENDDTASFINKVELKGPGFNHKWEFTREQDCFVCTDFVPPNRSKCFDGGCPD